MKADKSLINSAILLYAATKSSEYLLKVRTSLLKGKKIEIVEKKTENEIVTTADKKSEQIILDILATELGNNFNFLSEETNGIVIRDKASKYLITIDSLDGTIDFLSMGANFATTLGLLNYQTGQVKINLIIFPASGEVLLATSNRQNACFYSRNIRPGIFNSVKEAQDFLNSNNDSLFFRNNSSVTILENKLLYTAAESNTKCNTAFCT